MVPDTINAGLYLTKGDYTNMALSSMAILPFVGDAATGAKYVDDVAELGIKGYNKVKHSDGILKMDLQTFTKKKRVSVKVDPYQRPSGYRRNVKNTAWNNAKDADGLVRDPLTRTVMNKNEPWDMGHKPGYEFRKHRQSAKERQITRKQFLDEHNNPDHYVPELPSSNRSHNGEDMTDSYFGY